MCHERERTERTITLHARYKPTRDFNEHSIARGVFDAGVVRTRVNPRTRKRLSTALMTGRLTKEDYDQGSPDTEKIGTYAKIPEIFKIQMTQTSQGGTLTMNPSGDQDFGQTKTYSRNDQRNMTDKKLLLPTPKENAPFPSRATYAHRLVAFPSRG